MWILLIAIAVLVLLLIGATQALIGEVRKNRRTVSFELAAQRNQLNKDQEKWARRLAADKEAIEMLAKEKALGFPWLSKAHADYFALRETELADEIELKSHPAPKAADAIRTTSARRAAAERAWRICKYKLDYYQTLFPWLVDFVGDDLDELIRQALQVTTEAQEDQHPDEDPAKWWLTEAEFQSLSVTERNQLALERYWKKKKTKWEIGRDFERHIGYLFEQKGWEVSYQGIVEGLADLGRDLVARSGNVVRIVQCKYWSQDKQIHEKHIFQLFGTLTAYRIDHPGIQAGGLLVTSTRLSDRARNFAAHLGIEFKEGVSLQTYPCIKCNVSYRDGTKIYHLPFDQQYDRTTIDDERNECYVSTVAEAVALGFRRAFRWRGTQDADSAVATSTQQTQLPLTLH